MSQTVEILPERISVEMFSWLFSPYLDENAATDVAPIKPKSSSNFLEQKIEFFEENGETTSKEFQKTLKNKISAKQAPYFL